MGLLLPNAVVKQKKLRDGLYPRLSSDQVSCWIEAREVRWNPTLSPKLKKQKPASAKGWGPGKIFLISLRLNADYALGMPSGSQPRPLGIVVLSALQLFVAVYMLVISYQMAQGQVLGGASREVLGALASRAPYLALLAVLPAALSIGLYLMANWARIFTLVLYCLSLLVCILAWANLLAFNSYDVKIPTTVFNVLLLRTAFYGGGVIYLLRPRVVRAFREAY